MVDAETPQVGGRGGRQVRIRPPPRPRLPGDGGDDDRPRVDMPVERGVATGDVEADVGVGEAAVEKQLVFGGEVMGVRQDILHLQAAGHGRGAPAPERHRGAVGELEGVRGLPHAETAGGGEGEEGAAGVKLRGQLRQPQGERAAEGAGRGAELHRHRALPVGEGGEEDRDVAVQGPGRPQQPVGGRLRGVQLRDVQVMLPRPHPLTVDEPGHLRGREVAGAGAGVHARGVGRVLHALHRPHDTRPGGVDIGLDEGAVGAQIVEGGGGGKMHAHQDRRGVDKRRTPATANGDRGPSGVPGAT